MDNSDKEDMTVGELVAALLKMDQNKPVRIALQTYTQAYPSGYFVPSKDSHWFQHAHDGTVRFYVHLGEGWIISKKGAK